MKIGVFGGSFDPPHKIHKKMCEKAAKEFFLDKIIVIPTATPPHKDLNGACAEDRFAMASLDFFKPIFLISDIEQTPQTSYTYSSLEQIKKQYPKDKLYLIIGGDSLEEIHTWKEPEKIAEAAELIVYPRGRSKIKYCYKGKTHISNKVFPDVSSTTLRAKLEFGMDTSDTLSHKVAEYIANKGLYSRYKSYTKKLRSFLNDEKYFHSAYVASMGDKIARTLRLSEEMREKVYIACILHDCGKQMTADEAAKYGFADYHKYMHGFLGAVVAMREFGVSDRDILEAISVHTTAAPNMSQIAKILYIADGCEETREYNTAEFIAGLNADNFEERFRKLLRYRYSLLLKTKNPSEINPNTEHAIKFYL